MHLHALFRELFVVCEIMRVAAVCCAQICIRVACLCVYMQIIFHLAESPAPLFYDDGWLNFSLHYMRWWNEMTRNVYMLYHNDDDDS